MKIRIMTDREIADSDYDEWVKGLHHVGVPLDGKKLKETGTWSQTDDFGYTRATTTYTIVK